MKKYPLFPSQLGVFLECLTYPDTTQYNLPFHVKIDLREDVDALVGTWERLICATPTLRTRFEMDGEGNPWQWPEEDMPIHIPVKSMTEEEAADYVQGGFVRPFDLLGGEPLFRIEIIKTNAWIHMLVDCHHLVVDGFSYSSLTDRGFKSFFQDVVAKQSHHLFFELAEQEEGYLASEEYRTARDYFVSSLKGADFTGLSPVSVAVGRLVSSSEYMDKKTVDEWCRTQGIDAPSLFQAAFALTLGRLARTEEPAYLTSYLNRANRQRMKAQGMLVNQVAIKANLSRDLAALDFIREMGETSARAYAMGRYPFIHLSKELGVKPRATFNFRPVKQILNLGDRQYSGTAIPRPTGQMDMNLDINLAGSDYEICATSSDAVNSEETVKTFARTVKTVLMQILDNPAASLQEISLTGEEEAREIMALSRGETLEYNASETWMDLFLAHVKKDPEKTAVVDSKGAFTYGELDRASDSIAAYLLEKGAAVGDFVALPMGRVKEFLAAVIAVHKVGAAYVPIDPEYPEERIRYMLEDSEAHVVLTEETVAEAMAKFPDAAPMNRAVPEGCAYMIYTSGSTGNPKGVVIGHRAMLNFIHFIRKRWHLTEKSRIACHSTFSFDASVEDLYPALTVGGCVCIVPEKARRDIVEMKAFLKEHDINGGSYSTQFGQLLASGSEMMDLDYMCVGGEAMTRTLNVHGPVYNAYGPTEFTVDATYFELEKGKDYASIPIGRPVYNAWAFVCDPYGHLLPQGMTGELCLAGSQLAEGYWKQPELTAKSFVDCSFLPGQKMYRTGDLARYNEEGQLEYLGRIDHQVKLRGFRIELGEIETRAGQFAGIESVVAEVRREQLVLYYTSAEGSEIDAEELRHFVSQTLADYMVPTVYVPLSAMPMTPSGKIDRKALPEPEWKGTEYVAPVSETERALAEAFGEILGIREKIGASEDFFLLGGDSIKAIRLVSLLRERGIRVSVSDIMSRKTVRGIASQVKQSKETAPSQEPYEGQVPDTAIVSFFKDLALPEPWHYNQCLLLSMRERGVLPALQKAMDALAFQHDLLRAVWRAGANVASRSCARTSASCASEEHLFVRDSGATLAIEEYQAASEEEITKICNDIQSHIHMEEALVCVALIHGGEKDHLFIAAHHLVVDGVSWRILASDLERAYETALSGKTIQLPEKTHTYRDYAEALQRYRDSFTLRQEIPYWKAVEGKMKGLPLSRAKDYSRSFGKIIVAMDREGTARFLRGEFEKIHGDVNDALLAAVGRSFAKVQGVTAVSFQMEGHGREDLGEPLAIDRTVGWFTSIYPVVVEGLTGDMLHDLLATKEALHRVPNKGVGYNVLRFVEGRETVDFTSEHAAQIGFNYLGDMSVEETEGTCFAGSRIDTGDSFSRKNVEGPDLSIDCHVMDGCFSLHLAYARNVYDRDTAQRFAQGILEEMQGIASFLKEYDGSRLTATDLGENEWSEEEFEAVLARFAERGERIERIYPLLPMQEGMLLKHVTEPESWAYRLVDIYEMDWVPEESQLRHALARLGKKHEVLRTAILHEKVSVPRQAIIDRPLGLSMRDLSGEVDPEAAVKRLREEILSGGFDLEKKPLFRLTCAKKDEESCYIVLAVHHIIVDGWCTHRYLGDLVRYLKEEKQGRITEDTEAPMTGVYESAVRELLQQDKEQGLAYWRGLLEGYESKAEIPSFGEVPEEERAAEDECHIALDEDTTERLVDLCRKAGATPGNGVELLWGLVLSVCSRTENVVFAKVVSGRDHTETDVNDLVGLFINSVPVRLKLEKTTTALEALAALQEQTAESSRYDYCPLSAIQQQTSLGANLFQTVLAFENYNSGKDDSWDFGYGLLKPLMLREENFDDISPSAYIMDGRLHLNISFQPSKYREREIRRVLGLFKTLAEGIVRHPEQPLSSLARLNPAEREEMLRLSRGEELEYNKEETWLDLFLNHAKNAPDKTAVVDSKGAFTYGELERASNRIAAWLLEKGVRSGNFVALKMGRVKEFLAAVIAVHKVGAAYVPIDPEYPEERIHYMQEDSEAHVVLTEEAIREAMAKFPDASPLNRAVPEGRAYMIYTSGSTGKPKGVVQSHRSFRALVAWRMAKFGIAADSVHAEHASFSFDTSLNDLITPLAAGGILHIIPEEMRRDIADMKDYFAKNHVNGITLTTQIGMAMVNQYPDMPLRYLMMGGEKMLPCKKTNIRLINEYGPTEFTVCSSYHEVEQDKDTDIPIGRPVPNTYSFICDSYGHLLPQGMAGELCLAGNQIAEGYWKKPELTAKSFVKCSFLPGQKMYRTGDLARYNEAGELEYLGRIDNQVKLRGFRIEMGEIETRASQFDGIAQVAAAVKKDQLVLYYTAAENAQIDAERLREFLSETLTEYMVPAVYMPLAAMPMTPNGKIDRKALPEPEWKSTEYVEPANEREKALAEAFGEILGVREKIGAWDDFFLLGGDSIKAIRLVSRLRERGIRVSVADIMSQKTVRRIASRVGLSQAQVLSQEPYAGEVPDTAIVSYFKDLALPEPWHFNQCLLLSMKERADLPALQKALDALAFQHDLLRAVWRAGASCASVGAKQSHHAPAPTLAHPCASEEHLFVRDSGATLAIEEYQASSEEEITKICNEIQSHVHMEETLVRVALIHGEEGDLFFIAAHHLVVDGVSWRILTADLERAYGAALSGSAIALPEKTHTYRDYAETLRRYRDSYALRQEIPYWEAAEEKMKRLPLSRAKDYSRSFGFIVVTLDREATAKFLKGDFAKIHGDINDALLAAVGRSFAKVQGVTAVSFQMEGHGREDLGEPLAIDRTVGWFTSVYPVVVDGLTGDMLHDLLTTKEALHRVPNKGVGYNVLRFIEGERKVEFTSYLVAQIGFNYLGDMSVEEGEGDSHFTGSRMDTGDSFSRRNVFGPDLSINCLVMDGSFQLYLAYAQNACDNEKARQFARGILAEMEDIASFLKEYDDSRLTATDLGENEWSEAEFEAVLARFAERGERIERIYPLLPMQEGMLLKHVTEPESWAYRLVSIFEMDWVPEEEQLRRALDRLGKKHEVLRTAVLHENVSVPRQAIVDRPLGLAMRDLSGEADPEAAVKKLREEILAQGFDLEKKPLLNLTCAKKDEESCYVIVAVHHIIVDGWCIRLYLGDLARYLKEEKQGRLTEDAEAPMAGAYESAVREILQQDKEQGLEYWRGLLEGYETKAEIPSFGEVPEEERVAEDECSISLDENTTERLIDLCRKAGATPGNGVELLWGLVLSVCSRTEDVVFAKVVSGRDHTETDVNDLVGLLINSVPVRLKLEKTTTAQEALSALQEQTAESNRYDYCPLASIQQQTELGANLFQTVLAFENYNSGQEDAGEEANGFLKTLVLREEHFDEINPSAYILDGQLTFRISFRPSKYREWEIQRVLSLFRTLAEGIVRHPEQPLSSLARLNPEEKKEMLRLSRGEELEYNKEETWLDLFQNHGKKDSGKIAVVDNKGAFTYGELERASDSIAAYLLENGVAAGDFVALKMGRVKEFLAAVIAVHKVGAGYVPLDLEYPEERTRYMLEDSEAKALLTEEIVAEALAKYPEAASVNRAVPEGCAYMIYTSGSTGTPKGAVISHRALRAYVAWMHAVFNITEASIHAVHASFSFDGSIIDTIPPLAAGGTIHILSAELRMDMEGMRDYFAQNRVESVFLTTRLGMAMVNQYPDFPLRRLMMGGEKLLPCRKTDIQLVNGYGPTEFTVYSSYHVINWQEGQNIPIGRPAPNTSSFICDPYGQLLPQGMAGELCLAGNQIADGYWRKPELTAQSFVDCPFLKGEKMYRTGDLARYNEDGELEYLGRIDSQVKLRGFRIELGEIESRASRFAGISQVAAVVKKEQLVLYYTSAEGVQIDTGELRSFLAETLTEYMVPTVYMPLAAMPMTPNGKINRKVLPEPEPELVHSTKYEPPRSPVEKKLCEAFARALGLPEGSVGRNDDFYQLGGNSIKSMLVMANAGIEGLSAKDIFKFKTAARIAEELHPRKRIDEDDARLRFIPATTEQIGMIDSQLINVRSTTFNLPSLTRFSAKVDAGRLADAVFRAAQNHPALSTNFFLDGNGRIVQSIDSSLLKAIEVEDISEERLEELSHVLVQPFQIFKEPLFRARVFRTPEHVYLFTDMHHTISDGVSIGVFFGDVMRAYQGEEIAQDCYYTYLAREYAKFVTEEYAEARGYFRNLLAGRNWCTVPTPDFDTWDAAPGEVLVDSGITSAEIAGAEKRLGASKNVILIAAAMLALREYCGKTAIRVNFLTNNRMESWLQNTVGLVFKIFPVAAELDLFPTGKSLLREISRQVTECFANSVCNYSTEENIPLRDALLINFLASTDAESAMQELDAKDIPLADEHRVAAAARFDIYATDRSGRVQMLADYQKNAYRPGSAKKFMDILTKHLTTLVQTD